MWNQTQIKSHIEAANLLDKIKDEVFEYIRLNKEVSEKEVQEFILKKKVSMENFYMEQGIA